MKVCMRATSESSCEQNGGALSISVNARVNEMYLLVHLSVFT